MKKEYVTPNAEVVSFNAEDVITTSLTVEEGTGGSTEWQ